MYFKKMQGVITHEKVQPILRKKSEKKKAVTINNMPEIKNFPKEKITKEKIKIQLKDCKKESKVQADNLLKNFTTLNESQKEEVVTNELVKQEESFKERLQKRKLVRVNSQKDINMVLIIIIKLD